MATHFIDYCFQPFLQLVSVIFIETIYVLSILKQFWNFSSVLIIEPDIVLCFTKLVGIMTFLHMSQKLYNKTGTPSSIMNY
jgi:hypothetical protein